MFSWFLAWSVGRQVAEWPRSVGREWSRTRYLRCFCRRLLLVSVWRMN